MSDRIETAEDAKAEMLAWANGEKSNWRSLTERPAFESIEADAATAQMWAGVYQALLFGEVIARKTTIIDKSLLQGIMEAT